MMNFCVGFSINRSGRKVGIFRSAINTCLANVGSYFVLITCCYRKLSQVSYNSLWWKKILFNRVLNHYGLAVRYQPIVNMQSGMLLGAEALLRSSRKGLEFNPQQFVTSLERAGLVGCLTRWICGQVVLEYCEIIWACNNFYITINLSATDVEDRKFPDFMSELLAEHNLSASRFAFEVTEGVALKSNGAAVHLKRMRARGHSILLDDFGTGYSGLAYLAQLPVDIIKIDKSLTLKTESTSSAIILSHVLQMAKKLDIDVVVEGIESTFQAERVRQLGAEKAQGWLYSKELTARALVKAYFSNSNPSTYDAI